MEFIDDGGFANTRVAGNKNEFRSASAYDTLEGRQQGRDLELSPVELLRDQQSVRHVVRAQREWFDATMRLPLHQTPTQVRLDTRRSLITLLRGLREQLHHDRRKHLGNSARPFTGRTSLPCDMAVHPFHRIEAVKGRLPVSIS